MYNLIDDLDYSPYEPPYMPPKAYLATTKRT